MPTKGLYGEAIGEADVGDRQVPSLPVTKAASQPIETDRWFRNGKFPDASVFNMLNESMDQAILFRTKECFSILGDLGSAPGIQATSTAGTRARWRFAFRTSPYTHALLVRAVLFPPSSNYANETGATLKIYSDATESTLISTTTLTYGAGPAGLTSVGGWQYHKVVDRMVEGLTAGTEYYGKFSDENFGRLQSACVADLQSMSENYDGYLPVNFCEESKIVDLYRENLVEPMPDLWKYGGSKVLNWTANIQSAHRTTTSATPTNLIDGTSTTVTASSAGFTLDMRNKARLSQSTGVPIVMKVCGASDAGATGRVYLKSSGATICSIVDGWTGGTAWQSATGVLPATLDKYDLQFDDNGGASTFRVLAVSIYEDG